MLGRVVKYIDEHFVPLQAKTSLNSDELVIFAALQYIRQMLVEHSDHLNNFAKIKAVIYFIEGITFSKQPRQSFADYLRSQSKRTLSVNPTSSLEIDQNLSSKADKILGTLHTSLIEIIKWDYHFIPDTNGIIMNAAIYEWERRNSPLAVSKKGTHDLLRDITILGTACKTEEEVQAAIAILLQNASTYLPQEKELLKTWLIHNGGQDNNRFIQFMIMNSYFTAAKMESDQPLDIDAINNINICRSKAYVQDWTIENGRIRHKIELAVKVIQLGDEFLLVDRTGAAKKFIPQTMVDEIQFYKTNNLEQPTLLYFQAELELSIQNGVVLSSVVALNISSRSNQLFSPARIFSPKQETARIASQNSWFSLFSISNVTRSVSSVPDLRYSAPTEGPLSQSAP